jgi:predicted aldo/keto reductase-like oxidoreductase
MSNLEQMRDNIGFMKDFKALNQEEAALIARVKKIAESRTAIPCTACRYCVDTCPQSIPIPTDLWLYNETRQFKLLPIHFDQYNLFASGKGKASSCIECGKCEEHCPQHIKIPEELKKVAELFEKAS